MRNFSVFMAPHRNSLHWNPHEVSWDEVVQWAASPADHKACGNYLFGVLDTTTVTHKRGAAECTGYHRVKPAVRSRSVITLDVDHATDTFLADLQLVLHGHTYLVHPTFSSTPEAPRYRVLVPMDRDMAPDEYHHAATRLMELVGVDSFDLGSAQPERYMFKPATADPDMWKVIQGTGVLYPVGELLDGFSLDLSHLKGPSPRKRKRDPFAIEGTIGAFNRAYRDWDLLIETYRLPYEKVSEGRWTLVGAAAAAGVSLVTDGLIYSHHANDPAQGVTCSAFDLVRIHLHGHLDEDASAGTPVPRLPSQTAMLDTATHDPLVSRELVGGDFAQEMDNLHDSITKDNWVLALLRKRSGEVKDVIQNWDLITANDPAFQVLRYNEMTLSVEAKADLPWREVGEDATFDAGDRAALALHLEREYQFRPSRSYMDDVIAEVSFRERYHPVRDWLTSLTWDGQPRLDTCLPTSEDTPYTRLVARKSLVGAVARVLDPGCKFDLMTVLSGDEGLGKSHWIERMSRGYTAPLGRLTDKDTLIVMQRGWIMVSDEGHSMRKADFDVQKEFLTRTSDVFRMPYDREARAHPRHVVIWGTTNDDVFLKRQQGTRRFLILKMTEAVDFEALTDDYIDQVWAEAVHAYRAGEQLWLTTEEAELAAEAREQFTEEDALAGQVQEYVESLFPTDWESMSLEARQLWKMNAAEGVATAGTEPMNEVCSLQVWVECLGRRVGDHRRVDLLEINQVLKRLPGWHVVPGQRRVPGYGPQQVFRRDELQ